MGFSTALMLSSTIVDQPPPVVAAEGASVIEDLEGASRKPSQMELKFRECMPISFNWHLQGCPQPTLMITIHAGQYQSQAASTAPDV